jgi:hypothetical protein
MSGTINEALEVLEGAWSPTLWLARGGRTVFGVRDGGPVEAAAGEIDREDLIDRAIATEDEHAIKFTEACLRENVIRPDPVYLAAAAHAAEFLRGDN